MPQVEVGKRMAIKTRETSKTLCKTSKLDTARIQ